MTEHTIKTSRRASAFVLLVVLSLGATSASAQDLWAGGTSSWFTAGNWSAGVPTAATDAQVNNGGTAQIVGDSGVVNSLNLGRNAGNSGTLAVFSLGGIAGSLAVTNFLVIGNLGNGTMRISGIGSVTDKFGVIGAFGTSVGTVEVTGANASWTTTSILSFAGGTLTISGGGKVSDVDGLLGADSTRSTTTTVTGSGSTWTNTGTLSLGGFGGADVITIANSGVVKVTGQASIYSRGVINIGAGGVPGTLQAGSVLDDGTLHFNHAGTSTFSSPLSGTGFVLKDGAGITTITSAAGHTGTFITQGGQLILTNTLAAAAFSAIGGSTLRFDGATVNLGTSSVRANSDSAVEYHNATVHGGFLRGPGTHTLLADGMNAFDGVTTFNSTNLVQNGTANFINFANGGTLTNNANATLNLDGAVNTSSGTIVVNGSLLAKDFSNDGVFVIGSGATLDNDANDLVAGGGSRTTVDAGGLVFLSDGTAWELNGALLVNNGEINGTVDVNYGSLAKGNGNFAGQVNLNEGGTFSPGNSPGTATLGSTNFGAGGGYVFELSDATGAPGTGLDFIGITGGLTITAATTAASRFTIHITSLEVSGQPGAAAHFDPSQPYSFTLLTAGGGITGFTPDAFTLDHSAFHNDLAGGFFSIAVSGNSLLLNFTPLTPIPTPTVGAPGTATPTGSGTAMATPTVTATPLATPTPSDEASSVRKCQVAITKKTATFVQARLAALQQCRTKILAGKLSGVCPDDDAKTRQKIADALQKMRDGIAQVCGGKNKTCSPADIGADADVPRAALGFPPACPGFAGACRNSIADRDCGDIAACLGCIGGAVVDRAVTRYYGVAPADPKAAKALNACQRTIGNRAVKLFAAKSKALQSCWDNVRSGKILGPCPDAAKAEPALAKATAQFEAGIAKACCGKNKTCTLADGGVDADFDPVTAIGFPLTCDSVTVPGGPACDGAITGMQSLIACLACVTEFNVDCGSAAPLPTLVVPYPTECE